jgi:hypothetical protein
MPLYVYFNFKCLFHNALFKNGANPCALQPGISSRSRISWNLLQCASRTPEELLSGANFPRRLLQRGSQSGEESSGILLAPRWSREEPVFPHVVSSDEIAPHEILLLEEIPGYSAHGLAPLLKRALYKQHLN